MLALIRNSLLTQPQLTAARLHTLNNTIKVPLNEKEKEHLPVEKAAISPHSKHENGNSLYVDCVLEDALTG